MAKQTKTKEELRNLILKEIREHPVCPPGMDVSVREGDDGWRVDSIPPPGPIPYSDCADYISQIVRRLRSEYDLEHEPDSALEREIFDSAFKPVDHPSYKRRRARTSIGRAVLKNQVHIALSTESLLLLLDDKLTTLRAQRQNSDEAINARDEAIAYHEDLRRSLVAFRDATFAFLAGKAKEKSVVESAKSLRERVSEKFLDTGLFLLSTSICVLAGADPTLTIAVCGALVGGHRVVDAVRSWSSKKG